LATLKAEVPRRIIGVCLSLLLIALCFALQWGPWIRWPGAIIGVIGLMVSLGMGVLLPFSAGIDWLNEKIGKGCDWLVLLACLVSAGNAMVRYAYDTSSNAWLEIQWYMFAVIIMFGASYTLKKNEHVRVDIIYMMLSERQQIWVDIVGALLFLLPACILLGWLSWPFFAQAYASWEYSPNAGGLLRWPIKLVLPLGFALLALQGVSELIKRIAALEGLKVALDAKYERPVQ
jgi:TRAP-type mannitol/chloroaromatic compound transport system permease small subunit